jgi:DNA helicase-2/ATP-dependent DNA helicase PcrA
VNCLGRAPRIAEIEGNILEIDFEKAGRKRVLDSFVSVE